jgi:hypothetical protein
MQGKHVLEEHSKSKRHIRLREQFIEQGNSAHGTIERILEGDRIGWTCTVCLCTLESQNAVDAHLLGKKHRRMLKRCLWYSSVKDPLCDPPMVVHCVGDSHGGKYLFQSMSPKTHCHFITGSMHSFASGRRPVDLLKLGVREGQAVLFSYGKRCKRSPRRLRW